MLAMLVEPAANASSALESIRRRGQGYIGYFLWILSIVSILWIANATLTLIERSFTLLGNLRTAVGINPPHEGPDWLVLGAAGCIALVVSSLALLAYLAYRSAWKRRLETVWTSKSVSHFTAVSKLEPAASNRMLERKSQYLNGLMATRKWSSLGIGTVPSDRKAYCTAAEAVLRELEVDVAHRAITAGFVIGLNRNALIDSLTIVASALELQLHVLTSLGKRPSPGMWIEFVKRATASIFVNTYVTRDDALYLNLAIRKAALGLEVASESVQQSLDDVDFDEILGHTAIPGLSEVTHLASISMSVGASGLRHIGNFIEHSANDLLQGVLAGGILYYHGMAIAAECLALDEEHRHSPEMTRTISQAMGVACAPAGRLLREQVRNMRKFLRERRRQIFTAAKENVGGMAGKVRDSAKDLAERIFRRPEQR